MSAVLKEPIQLELLRLIPLKELFLSQRELLMEQLAMHSLAGQDKLLFPLEQLGIALNLS